MRFLKIFIAFVIVGFLIAGYAMKFYYNIKYSISLSNWSIPSGQDSIDLGLGIRLKNDNYLGLNVKGLKLKFYDKEGNKLGYSEKTNLNIPGRSDKKYSLTITALLNDKLVKIAGKVLTLSKPILIRYKVNGWIFGFIPFYYSGYHKLRKDQIE